MARHGSFLVFALLLSGSLMNPAAAQGSRSLRGVWLAQSVALNGRPAPQPPRGLALFLDSTYSFVAEMWPRSTAAGDSLTMAEKAAAYDAFLASSGSYQVVGDSLKTRAYIHKDPAATRAWPDRIRSYRIRIEGDTLTWDFGGGSVGRFRRIESGGPPR